MPNKDALKSVTIGAAKLPVQRLNLQMLEFLRIKVIVTLCKA